MGQHLAVFHFATGGLWVRGELLGDSWWLERHGFPMLVELPSGKEDFGIGEPVGEEDFGSFNDLVGGDEPLVHVGMQRGREALAATVAVFQITLLVESSVSSQDPPEADKSDGQKALEEAFEIAMRWPRTSSRFSGRRGSSSLLELATNLHRTPALGGSSTLRRAEGFATLVSPSR
jgi:hypothetical protein